MQKVTQNRILKKNKAVNIEVVELEKDTELSKRHTEKVNPVVFESDRRCDSTNSFYAKKRREFEKEHNKMYEKSILPGNAAKRLQEFK